MLFKGLGWYGLLKRSILDTEKGYLHVGMDAYRTGAGEVWG